MRPTEPDRQAIDLEEAFFSQENARLLDDLRKKSAKEAQRERLREVLRIKDDAFVDRVMALGISPETVVTLRLVPLVFVAWADGGIDSREREAITKAAEEHGVAANETAHKLLDTWLAKQPDEKILSMWKGYIKRIWPRFTADEQWELRQNLLRSAREVAEAAGGFLGLTSKISAEERKVLDEFEAVVG